MIISSARPRAIVEPEGSRYVLLKLEADDGTVGWGEAPAEPAPRVAVDRMKRELASLAGRDPAAVLRIDRDLRLAGASPETRAAVNTALLDLLAKSSKAPLYEYLGGPTRDKARALAAVVADSPERTREAVLAAKAGGHRAFSVPLFLPDDTRRGRAFFIELRAWMDDLRRAAGEESDFVLDCAGRISPGEALSIGERLEDFHPLWLDEPCGDLSVAARASISRGTSAPTGYGRDIVENSRFQDLLREDAVDVLRPSIVRNGVTAIRKAAALAESYYIAVAPHHRGGPIGTAVGIHVAASLPNSFIQETPFHVDERARRARREIAGGWDEAPVEGFFPLPTGPGIGVDVDETALAAYVAAE